MKVVKEIIFFLIIFLIPIVVNAETIKIKSFEELDSIIKNQNILKSSDGAVALPSILNAVDENDNNITINNVNWTSTPEYNINTMGNYTYTPTLSNEYELMGGTTLPTINVKVYLNIITISGLNYDIKQNVYKNITNEINISNVANQTLYLQKYNYTKLKWETQQTYTLTNTKLNIIYPTTWYKEKTSVWRIYIPETSTTSSYISNNINITTLRAFQNPSKYLQINDKVFVGGKVKDLKTGYMGLKVYYIQKKLKIKADGIYGKNTRKAVMRFQFRKRIKANGIVGLKTWRKLGFSKSSWYSLDRYVYPVRTNFYTTKSEYIETMINTAYKYKGTRYVIGAAGKRKTGVDCSGLVMQSLYSIGINPYPVSVIRHTKPGYEYESRNLWKHKKIMKVAYKNRKRGDLIFYKNKNGTIIHVAIYLGSNKVIEAMPNKVVVRKINASKKMKVAGVKRPIV